jgi:hypothetical protein
MPLFDRPILAVLAGLFALLVLWRYRPMGRRAPLAVGEDVKREREIARRASSKRERAAALVRAGELASQDPDHETAAVGSYLRAMRADPSWVVPIERVADLLQATQPQALEAILWRRLARLSWSEETRDAARASVRGLIALYDGRLRDRDRAKAMSKLLDRM